MGKTITIPRTMNHDHDDCVNHDADLKLIFDEDGCFAWTGGGDLFTPSIPRGRILNGASSTCRAPRKGGQRVDWTFIGDQGDMTTGRIHLKTDDPSCEDRD